MKKYNNYKDSGIEWIGEIPEDWKISRIGYNSILTVPQRDKPKELTGEVPWLRIEDFEGKYVSTSKSGQGVSLETISEMNLKVYPIGTVLTACSCTMGKTAIVEKPLITNQTFIGITPNEKLHTDFLYYFLLSSTQYLNSISTGAIQSYLSRDEFSKIRIPLPDKFIQIEIANYLDHKTTQIDNLIAKKEQFITLLQEERTAVINQAVTKGLDPTVKMKDSGIEWLGEIPEHWEEARIKNVVKIIGRIGFRGYTTEDLVQKGEGAISLSPSNIKNHILNIEDCTYLSWEKYHESPEIKIFENDIILVKTGSTIGKVAIIPSHTPEMTLNPQLVVFKDIKLNQLFLYYMMVSNYFQGYFSVYTAGGSTPAISQEKINNFKITFPKIEEQINISNFISKKEIEIKNIISKTQQEIELLKEYKTALISEVVTGKVDVRDVVLN
ncbi:restriction endonuclease subunit S [Flavobacterium ginsengiterrae]|uniref:Restriction endonuclease subunit S n=1 Tax=Flavobacterium ginsengiterrae TaxID=871695 RepID=A0ABP7G8Y4_9FLAO